MSEHSLYMALNCCVCTVHTYIFVAQKPPLMDFAHAISTIAGLFGPKQVFNQIAKKN